MSEITDRLMRGSYVSKAECFEHAEEIEGCFDVYPAAMAAFAAHEKLMESCVCEYDGDCEDGVMRTYRTVPASGCPVHPEEN